MNKEIQLYTKHDYIIFSLGIEYDNGKKILSFPKNWPSFTESNIDKTKNGLAMETGKKNNIIVIDIDNIDDWFTFLKNNSQEDLVDVPIAKTGKGLHYYFKYSGDLEHIKSKTNCFGKDYAIDIRTNGGCIILPPSSYHNNKFKYIWKNSIFKYEPKEMPEWMKILLLNKVNIKEIVPIIIKIEDQEENKKATITKTEDQQVTNLQEENKEASFSHEEIEDLLNMLSVDRISNYDEWLNIGICLYNINKNYVLFWDKISKKGKGYKKGLCESKWKTFKKNNLQIGSLLFWAKNDSPIEYNKFIKNKKVTNIILSKFPEGNIVLGDTLIVNNNCQYTTIKSEDCLIKGAPHNDLPNSMYIELMNNFMCVKCRHYECFGKLYPCDHIKLNKHETNIMYAVNGDLTINNTYIVDKDSEYIDFQLIDIYENEELNYLVYEGITNKSGPLARIIYYYNKEKYMYAEDNNWYTFEKNFWICDQKTCDNLILLMEKTIKDIYGKLIKYYKEMETI